MFPIFRIAAFFGGGREIKNPMNSTRQSFLFGPKRSIVIGSELEEAERVLSIYSLHL